MTRLRSPCFLLLLGLLHTACTGSVPEGGAPQRLTPRTAPSPALAALFDRDTTTFVDLEGSTELSLTFTSEVSLREFKLFAGGPLELVLDGETLPFSRTDHWDRQSLERPRRAREFKVRLIAGARGVRLYELEAWGVGRPRAPRDPDALALASREDAFDFENARSIAAAPAELTLKPSGGLGAHPCGQLSLSLGDLPVAAVRRAFLVYEATGVIRPFELQRSAGAHTPVGGLWLRASPAGLERTLVDELDPERLTEASEVTLCLPSEADHPVAVRNLRLVVELDDGLSLLDRESQARLGAGYDADPRSTAALGGEALLLTLARPSTLDALRVTLGADADLKVSFQSSPEASWTPLPAQRIEAGTHGLDVAEALVTGLKLDLPPSRPEAPSLALSELEGAGSGIGPRVALPRLVLTHPKVRHVAGELVGERFFDQAYVAGWVEGAPGAVVEVDGVRVSDAHGTFAEPVLRPLDANEGWVVRVVARLPDGTTIERALRMDRDASDELGRAGADGLGHGDVDGRFGAENRTSWGHADREHGGRVRLGTDVELEVPPEAVSTKTSLGITRKGEDAMPPLDPGMLNVTAPRNGGYRFAPRGQKFLRPVKVRLPYDERLLPEGMSAGEIQTFYFDELADRWVALKRLEVAHQQKRVVSETDHFTFMINAVLVTPEHPGPVDFDPTAIKSLKSADPSEGIDLISAPEVNNGGTARLSMPIRIPVARGAYQPILGLAYDSGAGNGYLGMGWDLTTSSVSVDTKFGVPYYDGEERYLLDGDPLVPQQLGGTCVDGTRGRRYAARIERDFRRILRCGVDTTDYRWEITSKNGTLHVYGPSEASRLKGYRPGAAHIAQWFLSRVIDANGNLTEYTYLEDRLGQTPGPFEQGQREDFRQLYLTGVRYSGRAARDGAGALAGGVPGPYRVDLLPQSSPRGYLVRKDVITSARSGFKTVQRYRLGRVQVWAELEEGHELVREYRLSYIDGDFEKSVLDRIELWGLGGVAGGKLFHAHDLEYTTTQTRQPFGTTAQRWAFRDTKGQSALDDRATTVSEDHSLGTHAYVGIGPTPLKEGGSAGLRIGYTHRNGRTVTSLFDLNGDSLPDRIHHDGVQLNHAGTQWLSPRAPAGDPALGELVSFGLAPDTGLRGLGAESGDSFNVAAQATYGNLSANLGYTYTTSNSREFLADADGDGLVDYVGPGEVLFNQQRSAACTDAASCCPAGQFCFRPDRLVPTAPALANTGALLSGDADLERMKSDVDASFHPTAALHEWTAPYTGVVDITGSLAWAHPASAPPPGTDGVRLRVFREGELLAEVSKARASTGSDPLGVSAVEIGKGQRLYFVLSTLANFPVGGEAGAAVPLEEVRFAPRVQYVSCDSCGAIAGRTHLVEPTGASLFSFDAQQDFKLAGDPMTAILVPRQGKVRVRWTVSKGLQTADALRLCLQRYALNDEVRDRPCAAGDLMRRTLPWASTVTEQLSEQSFDAQGGEQLVFRIESDLGFNPSALTSRIQGEMIEVCSGAVCAPPPSDPPPPSFEAEPFLALHGHLGAAPLVPFVAPRSGVLVIRSSNTSVSGLPLGPPPGPVFFSGRGPTRQLFKHREGQSSAVELQVQAGEQILFEAHSETYWFGNWALDVGMERTLDDGTVVIDWMSAPAHRTHETTTGASASVKAGTSPFGGGFHGWRYGLWGGREDEPFDPSIFDEEPELPGGSDKEKLETSKDQLDDPDSALSRHARLYAALIPRRQGTHIGTSLGLKPGVPAFVSQDGTTFITAASAHGAHKGGFAQTDQAASRVASAFDIGDMMRSSISHNVSAGLGLSVLSASISGGTSHQKLDVLDMNGDRILDVVTPENARITHLRTLRVRDEVPMTSALRNNVELSAQVGLGISDAIRMLAPGGNTRGTAGMFPGIGGGIGVNLSATDNDLIDVNGDGLPDRITRSGDSFKVRLNLGTSFAEQEDDLPVGRWKQTGVYDAFVKDVEDSGVLAGSGGRSKEAESRNLMASAVQLLGSADVVGRSTSVTLQANAGVMLNESFGVTANWETSLGATAVALLDVTGDGLPDYVRKGSHDGLMRVKVNLGYGFAPEELLWELPSWPGDTDPAFVLGPFSQLDRTEKVKNLLPKVMGPYKADTVASNGTHSALPSVGFVVTVPIPLSPFMTPWLHLSGGLDVSPKRVSGFELAFSDINGDGLADHVLKTERGGSAPTDRAEAIYARVNQLGGGNLLAGIRRPLGGRVSLSYTQTTNSVDLPDARWVLKSVVIADGLGSGDGHQLSHRFEYDDGKFDRSEREFLGFATVRAIQPDGSWRQMTFRNDRYEFKGLLQREEVRAANGRLYSATVNTYDPPRILGPAQAGCAELTPFFLDPRSYCVSQYIPLRSTEQRFYEGTTDDVDAPLLASRQEFTYDGFGNVHTFEEKGDPLDPNDDLFATVTYLSGSDAERLYLADRTVRLLVRAGSAAAPGRVLRERVGAYTDGRGNLTQLASAIGNGRWATTDLAWTEHGTVRRVTRPANKLGQRYSFEYVYDDTTGTYVVSTTDAFGYHSTAEPDLRFGTYARSTDVNGNSIVRELDAFGRLSKVQSPYDVGTQGRAVEIRYLLERLPARAETHNYMPDGLGGLKDVRTVVAMDGLGRLLQTKRTVDVFGRGEGMSVSGPLVFDLMGRTRSIGQTTFSSNIDAEFVTAPMQHPAHYWYDPLGRTTREEDPDGSITLTRYDVGAPATSSRPRFRATITDPAGNIQVRYADVFGREIASEEHLEGRVLTTHYDHDPSGDMVAIRDAAGNTTRFTHDLLGRRIEQELPDTGKTTFEYDPAGNLIRKQTPNLRLLGQSIHYDYLFERLQRVDHPRSADIVFSYGGPGATQNARGRLVRMEDEAGIEERAYGKLGEVIRTVRVLQPLKPGDRPRRFETSFTMDAFGRLLELTYPDGERVAYEYDSGGLLRRATGHRANEREVYLSELRYNVFGQKAVVRYGNGVLSSYQYDPRSLQLKFVATASPGMPGRTLQAISYDYDKVGNVTSMVNALGPPRGDQSGEVRFGFGYDALYRLTSARGEAQARAHTVDRFKAEWEYSDIHNMTRSVLMREQVRSLTTTPEFDHPLRDNRDEAYFYDGVGPHQATRIGDTTFSYDANGNTESECRARPGQSCDVTVPPSNGGEGDVSRRKLKRYQWNEENWLSAVVENGQHATRFVYDGGGNRIAKLGRGGTSVTIGQFFAVKGRGHATKHIFAGTQRIATKLLSVPDGFIGLENGPGDNGSNPTGTGWPNDHGCVPSDDQPNKCDDPVAGPVVVDGPARVRPATYYYHPDHLGSTQWVTDGQARVHERVEYYPYGEVWRSPRSDSDGGPTHHQAFLFTSKEFDEETGLTYFGARYYNPRHARWVSPDPAWGIQGAPGLNVYHYVGWNPTNRVDPDGRALETAWDVASFGMGVYSISQWDENTSTWAKILDVGGLVVDGAAAVVPFVPGGAGAALKLARGAERVDDLVDAARGGEKAVEAASQLKNAEKAAEASRATENAAGAADGAADVAKTVETPPVAPKPDPVSASPKKSNVQANRAAGLNGEDALRTMYGGQKASMKTSKGWRHIDNVAEGIAQESKVGLTSASSRIRKQVAKDIELRATEKVKSVEWHFFPSKSGHGPTAALRELLESNGIKIVLHD